jgi:SAM-dependent methyltransferase
MDTTRSDSPLADVAEVSVRDSPYDRFASIYNQQFGYFALRVLPVLDRLLFGNLPEGAAIVDVCCGTGQLAATLAERGFDVTGVDGSAEMLRLARQNAPAARFLHSDVRAMKLKQSFHAAVSTFDSINHILTEGELRSTLAHIHQALRPGGLLVFDLNMEEGFRWRWWGSRQGMECGQEYHIRAVYSAQDKLGHNIVTLHDRQGTGSTELRIAERCYSEREVRSSLAAAGFETVLTYDGHWDLDLFGEIGRMFFVCHKGETRPPSVDDIHRTEVGRDTKYPQYNSTPSRKKDERRVLPAGSVSGSRFRQRNRDIATCVGDRLWPSDALQLELGPDSQRLRAIEDVLCTLSPQPYERLRQQAGAFAWFIPSDLVLGQVHPFPATCVPGGSGNSGGCHSRVVYLSPLLEQHAWEVVVTVVAHELAHVILDHDLFHPSREIYDQQEMAVRRALREWGFQSDMDQAERTLRQRVASELIRSEPP